MKKVTTAAPASELSQPNDYATCVVSFALRCDGSVVDERKEATVQLCLDSSVCDGLEQVIKSMKAGEACEAQIKPSYGYGRLLVAGDAYDCAHALTQEQLGTRNLASPPTQRLRLRSNCIRSRRDPTSGP